MNAAEFNFEELDFRFLTESLAYNRNLLSQSYFNDNGDREALYTHGNHEFDVHTHPSDVQPQKTSDHLIEEFRSHLSVILSSLEESKSATTQQKAKSNLLVIENSTYRLRGLFNQLIDHPSEVRKEKKLPNRQQNDSLETQFMKRAFEVLNSNYMNSDFDVKEFSEKMNLSTVQLHRKIKKQTNTSVGKLIQTIRLTKAASLLLHKADSVTNIAYDTGFKNLSWFAKMFKQRFGVTPSKYADSLDK